MTVEFNHTIVAARDKRVSAELLAEVLGVQTGRPFGPFVPVQVANGVSLDFMDASEPHPQHYAFLVDDDTFDTAYHCLEQRHIPMYAEPMHGGPGRLNHRFGGRGFYYDDPDGHIMELFTRPANFGR